MKVSKNNREKVLIIIFVIAIIDTVAFVSFGSGIKIDSKSDLYAVTSPEHTGYNKHDLNTYFTKTDNMHYFGTMNNDSYRFFASFNLHEKFDTSDECSLIFYYYTNDRQLTSNINIHIVEPFYSENITHQSKPNIISTAYSSNNFTYKSQSTNLEKKIKVPLNIQNTSSESRICLMFSTTKTLVNVIVDSPGYNPKIQSIESYTKNTGELITLIATTNVFLAMLGFSLILKKGKNT